MPLFQLSDETRTNRTAEVFATKGLRTEGRYKAYIVPSGTATAAVFAGTGVLHAVSFGASAAGSKFWLFDSNGSAGDIGVSASAVARFEAGSHNRTHILDAIINGGLNYRLSAIATDGIVLTYLND